MKAILINIFGGIMRGDRIAEGVVSASREIGLPVPVVVRLEGTNVDLGKEILSEVGTPADHRRRDVGRGAESRRRGARESS